MRGGRPLEGAARVPAAKNSVLPLLAAALLFFGAFGKSAFIYQNY